MLYNFWDIFPLLYMGFLVGLKIAPPGAIPRYSLEICWISAVVGFILLALCFHFSVLYVVHHCQFLCHWIVSIYNVQYNL